MSYHRFNNLDKLINVDLAAKNGGGGYSHMTYWIDNVTVLFHLWLTEKSSKKVNSRKNV